MEENKLAEEKKAAFAPDKEKLLSFANTLSQLEYPEVTSAKAQKLVLDTVNLIGKVVNYIKSNS